MAVYLAVIAAVFGLCYFLDIGFQKVFRSKAQHHSGLAVRLNKLYSIAGVLLAVLGVIAVVNGAVENNILLYGGLLVLLVGVSLCIYHLSFGIFYDEDSFILTTFGKPSTTYKFGDICYQQLYVASGNIIVELTMKDGRYFQVQATMTGMYPFLDHAFEAWLRQTGRRKEDCPFYAPEKSCWFPTQEEKE